MQIKRSLVVELGPKAQPSISVGFELEILRSGVELVTHCAYSNFGKWQEIKPIHPRILFERNLGRRLSKIL